MKQELDDATNDAEASRIKKEHQAWVEKSKKEVEQLKNGSYDFGSDAELGVDFNKRRGASARSVTAEAQTTTETATPKTLPPIYTGEAAKDAKPAEKQ